MKLDEDVSGAIKQELTDWRRWVTRGIVLAYAVATGLTVVLFTWLSERATELFFDIESEGWWWPLLWMPLCTAAIVWLTARFAPGAAGSGIPQVMAALDTAVDSPHRGLFVSVKLSIAKMLLTTGGLLGGLSLGREGPSVQIGAGIMHNARRWLPERSSITVHGLLVAGGAAGIAAAFNTPLGGVMFAIEELSRRPEQRSSGLLLAAIVLAGLIAVSAYGNSTYFGVIRVPSLDLSLFLPGLCVAVGCGLLGGLFSRLMITSTVGGLDRFSRWRRARPVAFAAGCGLAVAVLGVVSQGATYGSGYEHTRALLEEGAHASEQPVLYVLLRFMATWISTWSGVPGGVFAPSLALGAGVGSDIALLFGHPATPALIALGMAAFLAAVTQAPLTAFIIVMEMVDGHAMVLSLMASAMVASLVSRQVSPPLYTALAQLQLARVPSREPPPVQPPEVAPSPAPTEPPTR